ncbi:MAG: type IV toxin-antitoxin system AbiEi family antitoxin domain-containing protein, partial [Acidimicrobiia bacterium]
MDADARAARLAAGQNGGLTRKDLRSAGLTDRQIDRRVEAGLLVRVHPAVFRHAAASPSWEGDQLALLAAGPGCAASHRAAARMHRLDLPVRSPIELTVPASDLPRQRGCRIHRTNLLEHLDVVQVRSMPVTSVARTLLDLGAVVPVALVEQ